ncbi:MAG: YncE family protein [Deltaproteobacteria bacterium]|nr:YncE family protein [Deltaproteobacteria bacterium]
MSRAPELLCGLTVLVTACTEDVPSSSVWPDGTEPIRGQAPLGYISNNGDDTVSVVELATMTELARVPVGLVPVHLEGPHHLTIDAANGWLYVGLSNVVTNAGSGPHGSHGTGTVPGHVQRLALSDLSPAGSVRVDPSLGDVLLSSDGRLVISTHFELKKALDAVANDLPVEDGWSSIVVSDAGSMSRRDVVPVCTAPHGAVLTSDDTTALVACYGDDRIAYVDLTQDPPEVVARVVVGAEARDRPPSRYGPYSITLSPDGRRAFIGNLDSQDVRVLDIEARAMVDGFRPRAGGAALFGAFSGDGRRFYVPTQGMDGITVLDAATGEIERMRTFTERECDAPHEVVVSDALDRLFVVCEGDHRGAGRLVSLDPESLDLEGEAELGVYPDALRVIDEVTW